MQRIEKPKTLWPFGGRASAVRILPFAIYMLFLAITTVVSGVPGFDPRWIYPIKAAAVTTALVFFWRDYDELKGLLTVPASQWMMAVSSGILVFFIWISLDHGIWVVGASTGFNPQDPSTGQIDLSLAYSRILGAALVVPIMEELFWRSFIMRWIHSADFTAVSPPTVGWWALIFSSLLFGLEHTQWAAGVIAGLVYGGLYVYTGRLWSSIVAHAVTNFTLGAWVMLGAHWEYW